MRSLLLLSTLSIDVFQLEKIVYPIINETIDKIYSETNNSYIIYTKNNITLHTIHQLPILLYNQPNYIIITHSPVQIPNIHNEWVYKKDTVVWYNYKEQKVKLWSRINKFWYESCDYPLKTNL
jgi:hypothetical protein